MGIRTSYVVASMTAALAFSACASSGDVDGKGTGAADAASSPGSPSGSTGSPSGADAGSGVVGTSDAGSITPPHSDAGATSDGGGASDSGASAEAGGSVPPAGDGGLFANCSLAGGCLADCSPPADDPIATGNASFDLYDGCILAAMQVAGMTETWQGQLLKSQAYNESSITPSISTNDGPCGGQNCGIWAISAGTSSGDSPPGPCGSSSTDPATGSVDYSHSYGLFQQTPACEGTFLQPTLPAGYTCTATTEVDNIQFGTNVTFYCESATSLGVTTPTGSGKGYINAVQNTSDPMYATSVFNPAYDIYVYMDHTWAINLQAANVGAAGCTEVEQWYLGLAYWLTGNATGSCSLTGDGLSYVQNAISNYETVLYNSTWPFPGPP